MDKKEFEEKTYEDQWGYFRWRDTNRLVHRTIAFKEIYLKDRKKYPSPFYKYQIDHKDGNKKNNKKENLDLVPIRIHELKHNILREEYLTIGTFFVFVLIFLSWYWYLGFVSGYKYNQNGIIFMASSFLIGMVLIYFINKKNKKYRYI